MGLTATTIENLKPRKADYRRADAGGLYILVRQNGSKLWRYDYRLGTVRRTLAIGEYNKNGNGKNLFTLAQARDVHEQAQEEVKLGRHPVSPTQQAKAEAEAEAEASVVNKERLFETLADGWLKAREVNHSDKTRARDQRSIRYLKEGYGDGKGFGALPVAQVECTHLSNLVEHMNKPTRERVISAAKGVMEVAKRKGFIKYSPFSDVDFHAGLAKHTVTNRPAITDETRFGELLRKIDGYEGRSNDLTRLALNILALTFVRPGTLAAAAWREFDLDGGRWVVPYGKLKMEWLRTENGERQDDFVVPLPRQAVALLRELHKVTGGSRYLFPGCGDADVMSENTINYALHALGYQGIHCAHGFRASASTILNRQRAKDGRRRFETALVEIQQDRLDASTRAIYDRDDMMPERIELMQFWADLIDDLRAPPKLKLVA